MIREVLNKLAYYFTPFHKKACDILRALNLKKPKALYLAKNAAKRRNLWNNVEEIIQEFSLKPLFRGWDLHSLRNYVRYGTTLRENSFQLSCPPHLESLIFSETETTFLRKEILNLKTPTHIFFAENGAPPIDRTAIRKSKQFIKTRTIKNSNHFFPVEKADEFANILSDIFNV